MDSNTATTPASKAITLSSNGALLVVLTGLQTPQCLADLANDLERSIRDLRAKHKEVLILTDISRVRQFDLRTAETVKTLVSKLDFDSMAVYGGSTAFCAEGRKFAAANHMQVKLHFFDSSKEAARWLAGDVIQQASSERALAHPIWPPRRKKRTI